MPSKTRVLAIGGGVMVAVLAIASSPWFVPFIRDSLFGTTGSIHISGPQVYTRERLVNDRYREDSWLLSELEGSRKLTFGITASTRLSTSQIFSMMASNTEKPPEPATTDAKSAPDSDKPPVSIDIGPFNRFRSLLTYREQVRSLMIENQLDDRHDLRGNSIYRLKFDAAVFPGNNTRRSAKVTVSVLPPEGMIDAKIKFGELSDIKALSDAQYQVWNRIYNRWLDSLEKRFNEGEKSIRRAYENNRSPPSYYKAFLDDINLTEKELLVYIYNTSDQIKALDDTFVEGIRQDYTLKDLVNNPLFNQLVVDHNFKASSPDDDNFKGSQKTGSTEKTTRKEKNKVTQASSPDHDNVTKDLDRYFESYAQGIIDPFDPFHKRFKMEIQKRLRTVVYEQNLAYVLNKLFEIARAEQGQAPQKNDTREKKDCPLESASRDSGLEKLFDQEAFNYFMHNQLKSVLSGSILDQELTDRDLLMLAMVVEDPTQSKESFKFKPQTVALRVTDVEVCNSNPHISISGHKIYYLQSDLDEVKRLLPSYDIKALDKDEDFKKNVVDPWRKKDQTSQSVSEAPNTAQDGVSSQTAQQDPHMYEINVEVGLINFIRLAGRRLHAFSYAFTPSEPDEISASQALNQSSAALWLQAAGTQGSGRGSASLGSKGEKDWNDVRKLVIGFGKQVNSATPTFGWMIQPQEQVAVGSQHYRHRASQLSLTALISLPAWWDEVTVKVKREWARESQDPGTESENSQDLDVYTIELPVNFEAIDAALFEKHTRTPVIEEWAVQPVELRVCDKKAALIIPGRRLWRSAIVTLGSQKANEIYVLPDMNGIIATFNKIELPTTLPESRGVGRN